MRGEILASTRKVAVETIDPNVTKTPITLEGVKMSIFSGNGEIKGLVVGNPEGFNTPEAISMGHIKLDVDASSIFSDNIIIEEILVDGPEITYEASIKGSNIKTIMDNIESMNEEKTDDEQTDSKKVESTKSTGKKIQINNLVFRNGNIHISSKMLKGKTITIPLPAIERSDIGKESRLRKNIVNKLQNLKGKRVEQHGLSVQEIVASLFRILSEAVLSTVAGSGKLSSEKLKEHIGSISDTVTKKGAEIKESAAERLKSSTKERTSKAIDKIKGLIKK